MLSYAWIASDINPAGAVGEAGKATAEKGGATADAAVDANYHVKRGTYARGFWNQTLDGLAVLGAKGSFRVYKLQRTVAEQAVVANSFHIKPLLRILQSADRYQVLALNRREIRLFEGNRDALDEEEPARGVPRTISEALGEEFALIRKGPRLSVMPVTAAQWKVLLALE